MTKTMQPSVRAPASDSRRRRTILWSAIASFLLLPLVAMQFTREVHWTSLDFVAAALLLGGTALVYDLAVSRLDRRSWRALGASGLVALLLLIWAQGAVGVF